MKSITSVSNLQHNIKEEYFLIVGIWITAFAGIFEVLWLVIPSALCFTLFFIFRPLIPNGDGQSVPEHATRNASKMVNPQRMDEIERRVLMLFNDHFLYRNSDLTLSKISKTLNEPVYIVSSTINMRFGRKLPEFINSYRIEEMKKLLESGALNNNTIEGLAFGLGFNTPSSFYAAFKKETGMTPQQYLSAYSRKISKPVK